MKYRHRVALNCDLFMTVETGSACSPIEELEAVAQDKLRDMAGVDAERTLSNITFGVLDGGMIDQEGLDLRIYPRMDPGDLGPFIVNSTAYDRLENFTLERASVNEGVVVSDTEYGRTGSVLEESHAEVPAEG